MFYDKNKQQYIIKIESTERQAKRFLNFRQSKIKNFDSDIGHKYWKLQLTICVILHSVLTDYSLTSLSS
jgi:hypothetical protein